MILQVNIVWLFYVNLFGFELLQNFSDYNIDYQVQVNSCCWVLFQMLVYGEIEICVKG